MEAETNKEESNYNELIDNIVTCYMEKYKKNCKACRVIKEVCRIKIREYNDLKGCIKELETNIDECENKENYNMLMNHLNVNGMEV